MGRDHKGFFRIMTTEEGSKQQLPYACVAENKLPPGVVYRVVLEEDTGRYPSMRKLFIPRPCLHCTVC